LSVLSVEGDIQLLHWPTLVAMVMKFGKFWQNCHILACMSGLPWIWIFMDIFMC